MLVVVVDGLGHGEEAAAAASVALESADDWAGDSPADLLVHCHRALRGTRGAVMSTALIDPSANTLTWAGIGNVGAFVLPRRPGAGRSTLFARGGVLGVRIPSPRTSRVSMSPGDTLVLHTDGVVVRGGVGAGKEPWEIAGHLLTSGAKDSDDALVFVARLQEVAE